MKTGRTYLHFLEDIELSMLRIQEYLEGMDFINFRKDYEILWFISTSELPINFEELQKIIKIEKGQKT